MYKDLIEMRECAQKMRSLSVSETEFIDTFDKLDEKLFDFNGSLNQLGQFLDGRDVDNEQKFEDTSGLRTLGMAEAAMLPNAPKRGVWKVGQDHVDQMWILPGRTFKLISRNDYNLELAAFKAYWNHPTPNTDESANPPGSE